MKINGSSIEFDNVSSAMTSINDVQKPIKVDSYSFTNTNSKGDFREVNSIEDLKNLHRDGLESAKNTFAVMNG